MIFIGFGFLMTFIRTNSWSALTLNWVVSIWCFQWVILMAGFWHLFINKNEAEVVSDVVLTEEAKKLAAEALALVDNRIKLSIGSMVAGDFGAGSAMICFGAILGKCNLQQLMVLTWWQMLFYSLNEAILV